MTRTDKIITPEPIKVLNKQLLAVGRRICSYCGGNKELTEYARKGGYYRGACNSCRRRQMARINRERYQRDPEFRKENRARGIAFREQRPDYARSAGQLKRQRERVRVFARIVGRKID